MRATRRVSATLVLGLFVFAPSAPHAHQGQVGGQVVGLPQPPARDQPPRRTGTSVITGMVTAAETGLPIRGAVVTLVAVGSPGERRTVLADAHGAFAFRDLAAGTYALQADPGMYSARYVGTGSGGVPGKPIVLEDGQRFQARIALPRAGAIEGRVVDEFGEPVARIQVYPLRVTGGGSSFGRTASGMMTDDLGRFRIYGLSAAEYIVAADTRGMGGMGMQLTEGETENFATTYYPSALVEREAMRVAITPGTEVTGLQIQLVRTRSFRISGTVVDSQGQPVPNPNIMIVRATAGGSTSSGGAQRDPSGRFTFRDIVPGEYRLVVRPGGPPWAPPGSGSPAEPAPSREYASVPVHVTADVDDVLVVTSPGVAVSGRVVFADGPPAKLMPIRISTMPADQVMVIGPTATAMVDAEGRFTLDEVFGPVRIRPQLPQGYALESVRVGSRDITDEPFEFRASHGGQVEVVLTGRVGRIEGQVTGDDGEPPMTAMVMLLPEDKTLWGWGSSRVRTVGTRDGRFTVNAILPGRYLAIAVGPADFAAGPDLAPGYYEALAKEATTVYVAEGETRTVDLSLFRRR